jgi:TRAP-type C4-dicarboxylate transport system permease small subunit
MKAFLGLVLMVSTFMQTISGIVLTFMIFLTSADVVLRIFGYPIPGAVEIIAICGGVVIGFTIPITSWMHGHISVDLATNKLSRIAQNTVNVITRCIGIAMFIVIGWNSVKIGTGLLKGGEVSGTLQLPLYPVAYGLSACFFVLAIVLFCDILIILGGNNE